MIKYQLYQLKIRDSQNMNSGITLASIMNAPAVSGLLEPNGMNIGFNKKEQKKKEISLRKNL